MITLNTTSGSYISGFFILKLDTDNPIPPVLEMDESTLDVFFHEYVHYLQDVMTTAGYQNLYANSEYLRHVINKVYKIEDKKFRVPFYVEGNEDNVAANLELGILINGDSEPCREFEIKSVDVTHQRDYQIPDVRGVVLTSRKGVKRRFGAIAIKESMAYLFERMCCRQIKSYDYPYDIAERLAERYSHEIASDPVMLMALCDMTLLCSNPAGMFISFLKHVKKKRVIIRTPEDIVDWFYNQIYCGLDGSRKSLVENLKEIHQVAMDSILSYVKIKNVEKDINDYFTKLLTRALELREYDRYFMISLARGGHCLKNYKFRELVAELGFPMLKNNMEDHFLFPSPLGDASILQYFSAIAEIIQLFSEGKENCGMKAWCDKSESSTPSLNCLSAPWKKSTEIKLCPYAMLWRHWNLSSYTPLPPGSEDSII